MVMHAKSSLGIATALMAGLVLYACVKSPNLSTIPRITFKSVQVTKSKANAADSISIGFEFEDGDGDLGLKQEETNPPYNKYNKTSSQDSTLNPNYYNIVVDYFEYNPSTGQFDSIPLPIPYSGRFKPVYQEGQIGKPLTGTIFYGITVLNFPDDRDIMFKIQIRDRALHTSNRIATIPFRIPPQ